MTERLETFQRRFFDGPAVFTRIGDGAIGGKAAGLEFVHRSVIPRIDASPFPEVTVTVPTTTVLTTDVFDAFMARNDLADVIAGDEPDGRIAHAFLRGAFPADYVGDLRALIAGVKTPLAVRSSSLLEDRLDHPFAGVYATKMIPNNKIETDKRFADLMAAVKFVWASTYFAAARSYRRAIGQPEGAEKMAVIIQEVVGRRRGDRFFPDLSGVGRSYNYYPTGHGEASDGVVNLALGLGKTIVDGGLTWTYCPAYPRSPAPFCGIADMLKHTQTTFWHVDMGPTPPPDPLAETEFMAQAGLDAACDDGAIRFLVSTYDPSSDRCYAGLGGTGPRVLDFSSVLTDDRPPLNDVIRAMVGQAKAAMQAEVEIEFAAVLDPKDGTPARLAFLQLRPMLVSGQQVDVSAEDLQGPALVATELILGNGRVSDLTDVVYVRPDTFGAEFTRDIARELAGINARLLDEGRRYLLIGFGRWGSSDPWLGIPVEWGQISAARVIVEATLPGMTPDLSQGSHFFHNLLGLQILYLSVRDRLDRPIDWDVLARQTVIAETNFVRHVRCHAPLDVRVDGHSGRGVVTLG